MDALLQDLLEYSRVTRASMPPANVDLDDVIKEIITLREKEIQDKQASVEIKFPLGVVHAHFPTVIQVLANPGSDENPMRLDH